MTLGGRRAAAIIRWGNAAVMVVLAVWFLLIPGIIVVGALCDANLRGGGIPKCAWRWHRALTPRYERWARERVASAAAAKVDVHDISGTEWPMFGSAFYLWATESLQEAWERDHSPSRRAGIQRFSGSAVQNTGQQSETRRPPPDARRPMPDGRWRATASRPAPSAWRRRERTAASITRIR